MPPLINEEEFMNREMRNGMFTVEKVIIGDHPYDHYDHYHHPYDRYNDRLKDWLPQVQPFYQPIYQPQTYVIPLQNGWRADLTKQDKITLSIDLPGVKESDLNVEIASNILNLSAKRFDTNESIKHSYVLNSMYDQDTISATLIAGVFTIVIVKRKEHLPKKIKVETK